MKASVGDRFVQVSSVVGGAVRDGRVVELRHEDGSPPYVVEWFDTGERTLVFPGPDARIEAPREHRAGSGSAAAADAGPATIGTTWRVQVTVTHDGADTTAQAVLVTGAPDHAGAAGRAHRNPQDPPTPVIGEEIAVARALRKLADRLIDTAEDQIEDSTGRPARVHA